MGTYHMFKETSNKITRIQNNKKNFQDIETLLGDKGKKIKENIIIEANRSFMATSKEEEVAMKKATQKLFFNDSNNKIFNRRVGG